MKYLAVTKSPSEKFIKLALRQIGWNEADFQKFVHLGHPKEDYYKTSDKYPIYAVADGVTLIQYLIEKKEYPNPSPAGEVARIFCEEAVREAEKRYANFSESDIGEVFVTANEAVRKYNAENGRTPETSDYWFNDLYAATGAFIVIKENVVYWASICDSYVIYLDSNGTLKFKSPDCDSLAEAEAPEYAGKSSGPIAKAQYTWRVRRNCLNEEGKRIGYGVITGEPNANVYLSSGKFTIENGDLVLLATDGFEEYIKLPEFITLLNSWPADLEPKLKEFTQIKSEEDPDKFGRERTLIACKIENSVI